MIEIIAIILWFLLNIKTLFFDKHKDAGVLCGIHELFGCVYNTVVLLFIYFLVNVVIKIYNLF